MSGFLITVAAFAVALGVLIAVHEFGHFWVARRMGVKVLRFSIGFGRQVWTRRGADGTEYSLSAVPLGGYVKMLDEREGEVPEEQLPFAFNRKPVGKRFAIVAAGPVFNFMFAIVAYWGMFMVGVPGIKPMLGEVDAETLAGQAGLRQGQQVVSVADKPTPTWSAVMDTLLPYALRKTAVEVTVRDGGVEDVVTMPFDTLQGDVDPDTLTDKIGLNPYRPAVPPVLGDIADGSPAAEAGLRRGDEVIAIDGREVAHWRELVEVVQAHPGQPLQFIVVRDGQQRRMNVRPRSVSDGERTVGRIGAGVQVDQARLEEFRAEWRHAPLPAMAAAVHKTWDMSVLTLQMLGKMVVGQASVENISGPITIAVYAKNSVLAGLPQFLAFLAIVSLSLGVLNLLPVPVLDGGHLMFYIVEMIKGSPVSESTEIIGQKIGLAMIVGLMTLAFYNDLMRLLG